MPTADDMAALMRYDTLAARVYGERRMPTGTRDLILAAGWVMLRDPRRHDPARGIWDTIRQVLNTDNRGLGLIVRADAPRYEFDWHAAPSGCQAPMVRREGICGRNTTCSFAEFDAVTGWMRHWGYCSRPRCVEHRRAKQAEVKSSKDRAPEPIPNTGGLLPLFLTWDWEKYYRQVYPGWKPPVYGLSADEWPPVPGREQPSFFPKLRLVASGGQIVPDRAPALT